MGLLYRRIQLNIQKTIDKFFNKQHKLQVQKLEAAEKSSLVNIEDNIRQRLKELEERMSMVFELATDGIWEWHIDEGMVYHNKKWCSILLLDENYLVHTMEGYVNLIYPGDRSRVLELINKAKDEKKGFYSEHRMLRSDGSIIWVIDRGNWVSGSSDKLSHMIGSIEDITQKIQAQKDLFHEKEVLRSTLLSVGEGVVSTDVNGLITVFNLAAEKLTGWKHEEVIGRSIEDIIKLVHMDTKETINVISSFDFNKGFSDDYNSQAILVTRTEKEIPILNSLNSIHMSNGKVTGFVMVFRDITDVVEKQMKIEYLSFHDELTGLYNRRYIEDALYRLDTSRNYPFTIMMLDINNLKLVNDVFGHEMGDKLIKMVAEILKSVLRSDDLISRFGGDEFCILLPKISVNEADVIKRRIQETASNSFVGPVRISIAVGYSTKTRENEIIEDILRAADVNMYKDKEYYKANNRNEMINDFLENNQAKFIMEKQHNERVSSFAAALYEALGKPQNEVNTFRDTALLHDIGKIVIPSEILNKQEALTLEEQEIVKRHPLIGYQILRIMNWDSRYSDDIHYHHERIDGSGYPNGLMGDEIPIGSKVLSIVDAYESMTSDRPYRMRKSRDEAVEELKENAGKQFDPFIVEVFIKDVLPMMMESEE